MTGALSVAHLARRYGRVAAAAAVLFLLSSSHIGSVTTNQRPISPLSLAMQHQGEVLRRANDLHGATGYFEAALVADPRNADAHVAIGQIAQIQRLPGKAIGHFRLALALRPDDRSALAGQGAALYERGAVERARQNLALLDDICGAAGCAERDSLARVLHARDARTALRPEDIAPRPRIETGAGRDEGGL